MYEVLVTFFLIHRTERPRLGPLSAVVVSGFKQKIVDPEIYLLYHAAAQEAYLLLKDSLKASALFQTGLGIRLPQSFISD